LKKFLSTFTSALLVIVLLLAGALVGVRLFGITPYTVLSGSMEPTYHVGSLIYAKKVDPADLKVGDPLTYVIDGGTVVTHRIVDIIQNPEDPGDIRFKTKGDNNKVEDGTPVRSENVLGKPVFTIPLLGFLAYFIQTPPTSYLSIGICVVIVLLTFLPDLLDKLEEQPTATQESTPPSGDGPPGQQDDGDAPSENNVDQPNGSQIQK
jgi:signal peptidase